MGDACQAQSATLRPQLRVPCEPRAQSMRIPACAIFSACLIEQLAEGITAKSASASAQEIEPDMM